MSTAATTDLPPVSPEDAAADAAIGWRFQQRYATELHGCHRPWQPARPPQAQLLWLNDSLAAELGLNAQALRQPAGLAALAGQRVPQGARPVAQAYAGHQFGGFSPQLGDGRALLLGELTDTQGRLRDIAFKGSGRTPFSRGGDGKAALGPVLREVLIGEAMHALGVPTTRALAAVATGETVRRDPPAPGALLVRVAASHLRVGTLQFFAAQGLTDELRRVADHAIARHDPDLVDHPERHARVLERVADRQARLVAQWMGLGFIHGVMNTDNVTLSGETIDYGPCAFMETTDPATVYSSIDTQGRYAYGNQPLIARWNLARLAEALLPLMGEDTDASVARVTTVIDAFPERYRHHWVQVMRAKLGLTPVPHSAEGALNEPGADQPERDGALADAFMALLQQGRVDFTSGFRALNRALPASAGGAGDAQPLMALFAAGQTQGSGAIAPVELGADNAPADPIQRLQHWLGRWAERLSEDGASASARQARMRSANPWLIPRNLAVEAALEAAVSRSDLGPFQRLLEAVRQPFDEREADADLAAPAAARALAGYRTFCGT